MCKKESTRHDPTILEETIGYHFPRHSFKTLWSRWNVVCIDLKFWILNAIDHFRGTEGDVQTSCSSQTLTVRSNAQKQIFIIMRPSPLYSDDSVSSQILRTTRIMDAVLYLTIWMGKLFMCCKSQLWKSENILCHKGNIPLKLNQLLDIHIISFYSL